VTSAFDTALLRRLRERLAMELRDRDRNLCDGLLSTFEDYKHATGIRKGLVRASLLIDEIERELSGPEPKRAA
jgi:hypothetical protein